MRGPLRAAVAGFGAPARRVVAIGMSWSECRAILGVRFAWLRRGFPVRVRSALSPALGDEGQDVVARDDLPGLVRHLDVPGDDALAAALRILFLAVDLALADRKSGGEGWSEPR